MSQENVETVAAIYSGWARGDFTVGVRAKVVRLDRILSEAEALEAVGLSE